ncbi:MAG: GFA family protein [Dongiaceae bacterium]
MTHMAACSCAQLSITVSGKPKEVLLCHCLECQKYTGSAFGVSTYWPKSSVQSIGGESRKFRRISDAGRWIDRHFCPTCGNTVYWYVEFDLDAIGIPIGNFANPLALMPDASYWNRSRHIWLRIPEEWRQYEME